MQDARQRTWVRKGVEGGGGGGGVGARLRDSRDGVGKVQEQGMGRMLTARFLPDSPGDDTCGITTIPTYTDVKLTGGAWGVGGGEGETTITTTRVVVLMGHRVFMAPLTFYSSVTRFQAPACPR